MNHHLTGTIQGSASRSNESELRDDRFQLEKLDPVTLEWRPVWPDRSAEVLFMASLPPPVEYSLHIVGPKPGSAFDSETD